METGCLLIDNYVCVCAQQCLAMHCLVLCSHLKKDYHKRGIFMSRHMKVQLQSDSCLHERASSSGKYIEKFQRISCSLSLWSECVENCLQLKEYVIVCVRQMRLLTMKFSPLYFYQIFLTLMLHAVCPTPYYLKARKATTWKWCISDPKFEKAKHILVIEQFSIFCK